MLVGPAATDRNMKVVSEPEIPEIKGAERQGQRGHITNSKGGHKKLMT